MEASILSCHLVISHQLKLELKQKKNNNVHSKTASLCEMLVSPPSVSFYVNQKRFWKAELLEIEGKKENAIQLIKTVFL